MKRIGLLAQKGGTGKTTLGVHLAVQAALDGLKVLLVDVDPQASATRWWQRRSATQPELVQSRGDVVTGLLEKARRRGYDLAVVDTAPHNSQSSALVARACDRVYIPTRPAILDLDAIGASTVLVTGESVPASIVLNACPPPTRRGEARIVAEAREALQTYGVPVCEMAVSQRAVYSNALIDGRVAVELDAKSRAAGEIERLWEMLKAELEQ